MPLVPYHLLPPVSSCDASGIKCTVLAGLTSLAVLQRVWYKNSCSTEDRISELEDEMVKEKLKNY
jgi:hypothetical protein